MYRELEKRTEFITHRFISGLNSFPYMHVDICVCVCVYIYTEVFSI